MSEEEIEDVKKSWYELIANDSDYDDEEPFWRCHHGRAYGIRCSQCRKEEEQDD